MVYWKLHELGATHELTNSHLGSRAADVAHEIDQNLSDVCTAAKELENIGLLVSLGGYNGSTEPGEELWDINFRPSVTFYPPDHDTSLARKLTTRR